LYFRHQICPNYLCLRLRPVCPTYEDWYIEHDRLYVPVFLLAAFFSVGFGVRRMDGSAEYCMEFSMFKQIVNCPYQGAIIRKCSDFILRCGVFWLRRLKCARYENLILGCVIGKPLA
jgi:hypothetical protein